MPEKLQLIFSHSFSGKIWNLHLDEATKQLALEIRNEELMQVFFQSLNLETQALHNPVFLEESWWVSLAHISYPILLFKIYHEEANATLKAIVAFDLNKNAIAWQKQDWPNVEFVQNLIQVTNDRGEKTYFNILDGLPSQLNVGHGQIVKNIKLPSFYPPENQYYEQLQRFIAQITGVKTNVGLEYLQTDSLVFLSYYTPPPKMVNKLLVVNQQQEILLHKELGKELKGVGQDTFFIVDNKLIFVEHNRNLFIYQLS